MTRALFILATVLTTLVATLAARPAFAQRPVSLRTLADAASFCEHSELRASDKDSGADAEAYDAARRRTAQRPIEVWLRAAAAPVIEYDRVTGSLEVSVHRAASFAQGFAVATNVTTVGFELAEERAQRLWARYEAGTAALKLTFLPLAWSDYDRPLCRTDGNLQVLDGEVLAAELVDEVGRPIVAYQTRLGEEVERMRHHRIQGYLAAGTPVVSVSALVPFPSREQTLSPQVEARIKSEIRAALYGCYLKGLAANGRLQGALVVKLDSSDATLLVDSLHDGATSGCAVDRINELRSRSLPVLKATVIFRLEEAPSL